MIDLIFYVVPILGCVVLFEFYQCYNELRKGNEEMEKELNQ